MIEIKALMKETTESSLAFLPWDDNIYKQNAEGVTWSLLTTYK
jgi:hypothetical protein